MDESTRLRVVFYQESGRWLAHCLETDLTGDGSTRGETGCLSEFYKKSPA